MSEDENSKVLEVGEKSENSGERQGLTSVVDVMNRARKQRCSGKKTPVAGDKIVMNPARSDAEMIDLSKKRLVCFCWIFINHSTKCNVHAFYDLWYFLWSFDTLNELKK